MIIRASEAHICIHCYSQLNSDGESGFICSYCSKYYPLELKQRKVKDYEEDRNTQCADEDSAEVRKASAKARKISDKSGSTKSRNNTKHVSSSFFKSGRNSGRS